MSDVQRAISQIALFWAKFASLFAPLLSAALFARLHFFCNFPRPSGEMGGLAQCFYSGGWLRQLRPLWLRTNLLKKRAAVVLRGSGIKFASGDLNLFRCQPRPDMEHLNKGEGAEGLKKFGCSPKQNERYGIPFYTLFRKLQRRSFKMAIYYSMQC